MQVATFYDPSIVGAWAAGARYLADNNDDTFIINLIAQNEFLTTPDALRILDQGAASFGFERPGSVSEMIMPLICCGGEHGPKDAIERGIQLIGRARRKGISFSGWTHTYFERFVGEAIDRHGSRTTFRNNKLFDLITKLNQWDRNAEAAFFIHTVLDNEGFRPRGGPCLQYVQFRAYGDHQLDIIGVYRAHDYANKALGNLIGLNRLGEFVAHHTGRRLIASSVVSLHPYGSPKGKLQNFANHVAGN